MNEQNNTNEVATEEQSAQEAMLQIQRIYTKDIFEAPTWPHIFQQEWKPNLKFDLSTETTRW